jgi:hypothetical protein
MPTEKILQQLALDRESRIALTKPIPFFELSGSPSELCPAGCVTIVAGLNGTVLFDQIETALKADDRGALNSAIKNARSSQGTSERPPLPEEQAAKVILQSPAYADARYMGRTLLSNFFVTREIDFVRYFLPYAGGPIIASDFQVSYFVRQPDSETFRVMIVAHPPKLSDHQLSLVRRIPSESREMLIGGGDVVAFTPAALFATVTAGLVGAAIGYGLGRALQHVALEAFVEQERQDLERQIGDAPKFINALPSATVQMLIAAKRQALAQLGKA